jgi:hypothetical protein
MDEAIEYSYGVQPGKKSKTRLIVITLLLVVGVIGAYFIISNLSQGTTNTGNQPAQQSDYEDEDDEDEEESKPTTTPISPYLKQLLMDPSGTLAIPSTSYYLDEGGVFYKFTSLSDCTNRVRGYKGKYAQMTTDSGYIIVFNFERQVSVPAVACEDAGWAVYDTSSLEVTRNTDRANSSVAFTDWGNRRSILIDGVHYFTSGILKADDPFTALKAALDK